MKLAEKICVVTGGANGIGRALCLRFAQEGATVIVADRDGAGAAEVAALAKGTAATCDVGQETEVAALVQSALSQHGRIDLFVSNAGIVASGGAEASDAEWLRSWNVNFMSHVWAARHLLPSMLARKEGYLLSTASAAGLLTSIGSAPYAVTKHAAVAFAEWLSITHGNDGIRVSCLCPQGVQTDLLAQAVAAPGGRAVLAAGPVKVGADFYSRALRQKQEGGASPLRGAELAVFLASAASDGITGKLISALWDNWPDWPDHLDDLSRSDAYTLRRITGRDRGFGWGDK